MNHVHLLLQKVSRPQNLSCYRVILICINHLIKLFLELCAKIKCQPCICWMFCQHGTIVLTFDVLELDNQLVGLVYTILLGAASFSLLLSAASCSFTLPFWSSFALGALLLAINRRRSAALIAFRFLCLCIGIAKIEAEERSMSSTAIVCIIINCWRNAA